MGTGSQKHTPEAKLLFQSKREPLQELQRGDVVQSQEGHIPGLRVGVRGRAPLRRSSKKN